MAPVQSRMSTIAGQRFDSFLGSIAARTPTPGGGAVASAVGAMSAALAGRYFGLDGCSWLREAHG